MAATAFIMGIIICILRPHKSKIVLVLNIVSEFLLVAPHLLSLYFLKDGIRENEAIKFGWLFISVSGLFF